MSEVDTQLTAYLFVCSGVGGVFGSTGFPAVIQAGFFVPSLWLNGVVLLVIGIVMFALSVRRV